ncbi:outer membrane protein TolC [Hymenobacter luteus]|uniref:Outer membrane protein TolC n=2 Tax=Hymenobacter TaxID=89966 RepID=A0A7W9T5W9_9BACT|nr:MULTISPECIES: TolC family protein [Hymenobacter]MBB4603677.1 outer membrane protein TolC [Hymenobacter latericoloratus]MBB6061424.1 outer membrane protein TolC [Hymenobacter luteus]
MFFPFVPPVRRLPAGSAWLLVALLLTGPVSQAQQRPVHPAAGRPLSLKEALDLARTQAPHLQAKAYQVQAAEADIAQTKTQRLPSVRLSGQVSYGSTNAVAGTMLPVGTIIPSSGSLSGVNSYNAVFGSMGTALAEWSPVTFGQYPAQRARAEAARDYAQADADNELFTQQLRVAQTYLDLLATQSLRQVREQDVRRVFILKKTITRLALHGLRPGVDSTLARAAEAQSKLALVSAQEQEADRQARLSTLLGQPGATWQPDTLYNRTLPPALVPPTATHPTLGLQQRAVDLGQARETVIRRQYRPRLSLLGATWGRGSGLSYNGTTDYGLGGAAPTRFNYAVGVGVVFDLLDWPRVQAQAKAENLRTQGLQAEYRQQQLELSNQATLANQRLQLAAERARQAPLQLAAARQAYRQKLALYNSGLATVVDVTQALYGLQQAEQDQVLTANAAWHAVLLQTAAAGDFSFFFTHVTP